MGDDMAVYLFFQVLACYGSVYVKYGVYREQLEYIPVGIAGGRAWTAASYCAKIIETLHCSVRNSMPVYSPGFGIDVPKKPMGECASRGIGILQYQYERCRMERNVFKSKRRVYIASLTGIGYGDKTIIVECMARYGQIVRFGKCWTTYCKDC